MQSESTMKFRVDILESERGWGSRIDESIFFDDATAAWEYVENYNKKHNPPGPAPDWYMVALDPVKVE